MRELTSKISYLHGLVEGLDLETTTKEGRILTNIIDILDDMAESIKGLQDAQIELENYVETIDEDLYELEDDFYEEDDDEDEELEEDLDEEEEYVEVECPKCHDLVYFDSELLDDDDIVEISCPNCDEIVFKTEDNNNDED
ncbi:MAG: hypothetical protein JM58_01390 [Peptococcaceae bacterium BICA1-8]|nr:MAG: hypothetical protein JM58_01390 [Peptococcaceae bacterium BICA1-8]